MGVGALQQVYSSHHSWKFAACVESQKSMPITAEAVSPAGSNSADTQRRKDDSVDKYTRQTRGESLLL